MQKGLILGVTHVRRSLFLDMFSSVGNKSAISARNLCYWELEHNGS